MNLGDLSPQEKLCRRCDTFKNLSSFDRDADKPDGYKEACKTCRAEANQAQRLREATEVLKSLEKSVISNLANSKPGGPDVPHVAEIYESAINLLGGVHGLTQQLVATYLAAPPGSQTRERILGQLIKIGMVISDSKKVEMPVELMSDQDLEREIKERKKTMIIDCQIVESKEVDDKLL